MLSSTWPATCGTGFPRANKVKDACATRAWSARKERAGIYRALPCSLQRHFKFRANLPSSLHETLSFAGSRIAFHVSTRPFPQLSATVTRQASSPQRHRSSTADLHDESDGGRHMACPALHAEASARLPPGPLLPRLLELLSVPATVVALGGLCCAGPSFQHSSPAEATVVQAPVRTRSG